MKRRQRKAIHAYTICDVDARVVETFGGIIYRYRMLTRCKHGELQHEVKGDRTLAIAAAKKAHLGKLCEPARPLEKMAEQAGYRQE